MAPGGNQPPGATLTYTVLVTNNGTGSASAVVVNDPIPANTTYVGGSAAGAGTTIEYSLPQASHVTLTIYNLQGQKIITLIDAQQDASTYQIQWDGRTSTGQHVATGVYLYRLDAGEFVAIKKTVFLK